MKPFRDMFMEPRQMANKDGQIEVRNVISFTRAPALVLFAACFGIWALEAFGLPVSVPAEMSTLLAGAWAGKLLRDGVMNWKSDK